MFQHWQGEEKYKIQHKFKIKFRSLLDVTRTIFVWGIGLIIPNPNGGYWETFSLLQVSYFF